MNITTRSRAERSSASKPCNPKGTVSKEKKATTTKKPKKRSLPKKRYVKRIVKRGTSLQKNGITKRRTNVRGNKKDAAAESTKSRKRKIGTNQDGDAEPGISQPKKRNFGRPIIRDSDDEDADAGTSQPKKRNSGRPIIRDSDNEDADAGTSQPPVAPRTKRGRKRSSPMWEHYDEVVLTVDGVEGTYAKCKHCERKYKVSEKSNRSTGNMRRHTRKEHSDLIKSSDKFVFSQENFRKILLKWIVTSNQPFSVVEEDEFAEFIMSLNPSAEIPSDKAIKADLMVTYGEKVEQIKKLLQDVPGKISITMDMWSSKNVLPFLVIRAHWISKEWEYKTQLLDFAPVKGDHDGFNQSQIFLKCISTFDIKVEQVLAFTMDNASPNDTFLDCLREHGIEIGSDISATDNQVRCLAHILNLTVQDILEGLGITMVVNTEDELLDYIEMVIWSHSPCFAYYPRPKKCKQLLSKV